MSQVTLRAVGTALEITARMGTEPPLVAGYASWRTEARPRRKPLTIYDGQAPLVLTLPIVFDRFVESGSVEPEISELERMAQAHGDNLEPPPVQVRGPVPHSGETWVISDLAWGDVTYNDQLQRSRQFVTVTLTEYVRADQITRPTSSPSQQNRKRNASPNRGSKQKRHVVRSGDTLTRVAAHVLGDHRRWRELAQLNDVKDPNLTLKPGRVLRMP
jgi:LysM domain